MFGGVPIVGGLESALMGQTNFRARAPGTAAGTEAIRKQTELAARRNAAAQYSLAASARGPGAGLAAREAQRRGSMMGNAGIEQAGIQQSQLEQNALNQQMQAQEINAKIAMNNSGGLQKLAGTALGAMGGLALMSDERAKSPIGPGYGSQLAGHEDGRRVQWVQSGPDEREQVAAHAQAQGVRLGPGDWQAMGYQPPGAAPMAMAPAPAVQPSPGLTGTQRTGYLLQALGQGMQPVESDKRAKVLAQENTALKEALHSAVLAASGVDERPVGRAMKTGAARAGAEGARAGRAAITPDVLTVRSDGKKARVTSAYSEPLNIPEQQRMEGLDMGPRPPVQVAAPAPMLPAAPRPSLAAMIRSDEDAKHGMGMSEMQFPRGVEPRHFVYKPGMGDGGEHFGLYAQDLEKSREGRTVVDEDPETGMKMVDPGHLTMLNTAKLAEMDKRMRAMEGRKRAG